MNKNPLAQLPDYGQSFWYDNIQRSLLENGEMQKMITSDGLRGVTSNPSIFEKAIAQSEDYDASLLELKNQDSGITSRKAFFSLAIEDIQAAADLLKPVYDSTEGLDGYVSLEVSPDIAHDTQASIEEAQQLFARLKRPNAMIKIPATKAGIPVIEQLVADGINVNATLLFSVERYIEVAHAYIRGLKVRQQRGLPLDRVASVASFFVSRVDVILDKRLQDASERADLAKDLMGQMGIANAKLAYKAYLELIESNDFKSLVADGARPQRLLWASTGVKNPELSDVLYIDGLIGKDTVNTIPPATANAFKDHGTVAATLEQNLEHAETQIQELKSLGIDLHQAMDQLEVEGVAAFEKSFEVLLGAIDDKMKSLGNSTKSSAA